MTLAFALLADAANVSQEGKLNVLGAFDRMTMALLPNHFGRFWLILRFRLLPSDGQDQQVTIRLLDPDSRELAKMESELEIQERSAEANALDLILPGEPFVFQHYGPHRFEILIANTRAGEIDFTISPPVTMAPPDG